MPAPHETGKLTSRPRPSMRSCVCALAPRAKPSASSAARNGATKVRAANAGVRARSIGMTGTPHAVPALHPSPNPALRNRGPTRACKPYSTPVRRAPALELLARLRPRRIDAEDRAPLLDLLLHEILERGLLEGFLGHLLCKVLRDHDHALVIADDDVARIDRHFAARDRNVEIDRVMLDQVGGRRGRRVIS